MKASEFPHFDRKCPNGTKNWISCRLKKIQDRSVLIVYEIETRQKGPNEVDQKFILWAEIYIYNPSTDLFERKYRKLLDFV